MFYSSVYVVIMLLLYTIISILPISDNICDILVILWIGGWMIMIPVRRWLIINKIDSRLYRKYPLTADWECSVGIKKSKWIEEKTMVQLSQVSKIMKGKIMTKRSKDIIIDLTAVVMLVAAFWIKNNSGAIVSIIASLMLVDVAMNSLIEHPEKNKVLWIVVIVFFLLYIVLELIGLCLG